MIQVDPLIHVVKQDMIVRAGKAGLQTAHGQDKKLHGKRLYINPAERLFFSLIIQKALETPLKFQPRVTRAQHRVRFRTHKMLRRRADDAQPPKADAVPARLRRRTGISHANARVDQNDIPWLHTVILGIDMIGASA
jgi:hypothetical protein